MIRFRCRCSEPLAVPDELAGSTVDCPACGKLNDIPLLSDVQNLEEDGLYRMTDEDVRLEPNRTAEQFRAFTRQRTVAGGQIDLRPTADQIRRAGVAVPSKVAERPKYDPMTGEMFEPLPIVVDEGPKPVEIPMAKRALNYATDQTVNATIWNIPLLLCQPLNAAVMGFVVIGHIFLEMSIAPIAAGLIFFIVAPVFLVISLLGHYANVVEDIATKDVDELPRPLRDFEIYADIWQPFTHVMGAILLCLVPGQIVIELAEKRPLLMPVGVGILAVGTILLPSVFLTLCVSGHTRNLRPDRVVAVMLRSGIGYWMTLVLLLAGMVTYWVGFTLVTNGILGVFSNLQSLRHLALLGLGGTVTLILGVFILHWACWTLGLLYRTNHESYPWVLQRHIRKPRTDAMSELERERRKKVLEENQRRAQRTALTNDA